MPPQTTTAHTGVLVNLSSFVSQVYAWMTGGLLVTAAVAWVVSQQQDLATYIRENELFGLLIIVELIVVIALSAFINKMNAFLAGFLFLLYAVLNGVFFGAFVFALFEIQSVYAAFAATAGTFAVMTVYGLVTKSDLTKFGSIAIMGLFGLIIGSLVNVFLLQSDSLGMVLTYIGIFIFIILIAFDTQKLKTYAQVAEQEGNATHMAILGALSLYLDFINLFIRLLAIFGKRK
jgi:uncharacterized protein